MPLRGQKASLRLIWSLASSEIMTSMSGETCKEATQPGSSMLGSSRWEKWNLETSCQKKKKEKQWGFPVFTGEYVSTPEPSGQDEGDGPNCWGKVETFCQQGGGEEPGPNSQMGGEVTRIHRQFPGTFWSRWSMGVLYFYILLSAKYIKYPIERKFVNIWSQHIFEVTSYCFGTTDQIKFHAETPIINFQLTYLKETVI